MCFIYYDIRYLYYSQIGDVIRDILSKSNFLISDPEFWLKQIIDVWPDPEANPQWPAKKDNYGGDCKENIILFYILFYFGGGEGVCWKRAARHRKLFKTFIISRCRTFAGSGWAGMVVAFSYTAQFLLPFVKDHQVRFRLVWKKTQKNQHQHYVSWLLDTCVWHL